jgi:hypothetical protein
LWNLCDFCVIGCINRRATCLWTPRAMEGCLQIQASTIYKVFNDWPLTLHCLLHICHMFHLFLHCTNVIVLIFYKP